MRPFHQFSLWVRQGPRPERRATAAVAVILAGLLAWALVPAAEDGGIAVDAAVTGPESSAAPAGGVAAGPATTTSTVAGAPAPSSGAPAAPSAGSTTAGPVAASAPAAGTTAATSCPGGTDQGVDGDRIRIAVALPDIQGQAGNSLVGLPSYDEQVEMFRAAITEQNKRGGAACRSIDATYFNVNPIDPAQAQRRCLDIVQGKFFAAVDIAFGYVAAAANCLAQHQVPDIATSFLLPSQIKDYYPYNFSLVGQWDRLLRDYVQGLKALGWFDPGKGFKKLGVLDDDCFPEVNKLFFGELARIGIQKSDVVEYDFGGSTCTGIPPANQYQQAVLNFTRAGVTHVADVVAPTVQLNYFSRVAAAQRAKFHYSLPDRGAITTFESAGFSPDRDNFDGAIAITQSQYGALKSKVAISGATKRCNDAMAAAGQPSVETSGVNFAGQACNFTWMVAAALSHVPALTRTSFVTGLGRSGALDFSYPAGPARFDRVGVVAGGQFWRPARYEGACSCFKLVDPTFKPNFP